MHYTVYAHLVTAIVDGGELLETHVFSPLTASCSFSVATYTISREFLTSTDRSELFHGMVVSAAYTKDWAVISFTHTKHLSLVYILIFSMLDSSSVDKHCPYLISYSFIRKCNYNLSLSSKYILTVSHF